MTQGIEFRPVTTDEIDAFYGTFFRSMGFPLPGDEQQEHGRKTFLCDRSLAAFDAGAVVGTTYSHLFELTLPGGAQVPAAAVTAVSASTTHRRRGIVTELMRRQLLEARDRGEPAAILIASEGKIYSRFGYGVATHVVDTKLDTRDVTITAPPSGGRVVIVDGDTADKVFPNVYDAARRARAGSTIRPDHFWTSLTMDRNKKHVHAVYEDASGEARGYVRYVLESNWTDGLADSKLIIQELTAATDEATIELWRYLLTVDLVRHVEAWSQPIDDPLRWVLAEARALRATTYRDMLWLRPLDAPRLLGSRTYATDIELTILLRDRFFGEETLLSLSGGPTGAECTAGSGNADITIGSSELGSILLGGTAPSELARAGRIEAASDDVLRRADAAFLQRPRPWGNTYF